VQVARETIQFVEDTGHRIGLRSWWSSHPHARRNRKLALILDGTDSWEIAARKPVAAKAKATPTIGSYQARNKKTGSEATMQLAAALELSKSMPHDAVAVQDKRKVAVRKSDKE